MKNFNRFISLVLVAVMLLMAVSCNSTKATEGASQSESDSNITSGESKTRVVLVVGSVYRNGDTMKEALEYLKDAVAKAYNAEVEVKADAGYTIKADELCILVGDTKFEEYNSTADGMKIDDFAYKAESDKLVVINGGSIEAILEGVKQL